MEKLLTVNEVADVLGVTRAQVYRLVARGLPAVRVGTRLRFAPSEIRAYLDKQREEVR